MCQAVDDLELELITKGERRGERRGKKQGFNEGKRKGKTEGILEQKFKTIKIMLKKGLDLNTIVEFGFTRKEIEQAMNI